MSNGTKMGPEALALDNEAPNMKDYKVSFVAIINGYVLVSARNRKGAAEVFKNDPDHQFDSIESFKKFKVTKVEET